MENRLHEKCIRCGRRLKSQDSKELGFGKTCWEKYNSENKFKELFPMKNTLAHNASSVCEHQE